VKIFLTAEHRDIIDLGTHSTDPGAIRTMRRKWSMLREKRADRGILLCGSRVGASMAANRIPRIRDAL
jgi:ribose 5-phosphate isomerase RpiB